MLFNKTMLLFVLAAGKKLTNKQTIASLQATISKLEAYNVDLKQNNDDLIHRCNYGQEEIIASNQMIMEMQEEVNGGRKEIIASNQLIMEMQEESKELNKQIIKANAELEFQNKTISEILEENKEPFQREVEEIQGAMSSLELTLNPMTSLFTPMSNLSEELNKESDVQQLKNVVIRKNILIANLRDEQKKTFQASKETENLKNNRLLKIVEQIKSEILITSTDSIILGAFKKISA